MEYEAARTELLEEIKRGASVDELQKRLLKQNDTSETKDHSHSESKGRIETKISKHIESKKDSRVDRTQRRQIEIMNLLNKHRAKSVDEKKLSEPRALTAVELFAKAIEERDGSNIISKKIYRFADKELLVRSWSTVSCLSLLIQQNKARTSCAGSQFQFFHVGPGI